MMGDKTVDLFDQNFKVNHLINKHASHQVRSLKPGDKNIELRAIVISKKDAFTTKKQVSFCSFVIADSTGSVVANFFGQNGEAMSPGDILYINGAYTSLYNGQLILYEGKGGVVFKIGEFFFNFTEEPNVSTMDWSEYNKMGGSFSQSGGGGSSMVNE